MRLILAAVVAAGLGVGALVAQPVMAAEAKADKAATDVPVKVVVLFSSGVGYFEHVGNVRENASTELRFKTNQINDILKSLVLQDVGGGRVASVVYPSLDPLAKTLKSFQIDITNNPSLADLLNQLRGAKVKLTAEAENIEGTILGLEKKPKAVEKGQIEVWQINLVSSAGVIRSLPLDSVTRIELEDPVLQEELNKALAALAQARDQDKKPVTIQFQGQGERLVRLGYVVETPVWKTSYRLILGDGDQKSTIQGWAIVENQTDNDWNNVQLSLVSGRPISFIQELYQPLYIPRPVVYPELFASLKPQTYEGGMEKAAERKRLGEAGAAGEEEMPASAAVTEGGRMSLGRRMSVAQAAAKAPTSSRDALMTEAINRGMDVTASVQSIASAAKMGELFQYTVGNVSLPRQRSAMIPIVTDPIEVERVSIYNQSVLAKNPLNGARIKNTTEKHLLQGPITVLEGSNYAGDARIENLPPGQERLISFGIDLQVMANATKNKQESALVTGSIVKGVLNLKRKHVFTQEYAFENKDSKPRTIIIEHPIRQGWKLVEPEKPIETTESVYRFRTSVAAGKPVSMVVREEIVQGETLAILSSDLGTLEFYARAGEIPQSVREALAKAASLKRAMTDAQREVEKNRQQISQVSQDQARVRENLKVAPDQSTLRKQLLEKFQQQETQIGTLFAAQEKAQQAFEKARQDLENYLAELNVE